MAGTDAFPPIEELGVVGNCRTAALISTRGTVEWLCAPRFDSPSVFASLLDRERGGRFAVTPVGVRRVERRYLPDTVVLESTFHCDGGVLRLTDCMPVTDEEKRRARPWPEHQLLRKLECLGGEVDVDVVFSPRADYGRAVHPLSDQRALGIRCQGRGHLLSVLSDVPLRVHEDGLDASGRATLRTGEVRWVSLLYAWGEPAVFVPNGEHAEALLEETARWWRDWAGRVTYEGPWRDAVVRSALTLKLLTYAPSGAVLAAVTTSLPEAPGKGRNWDYRYCWLRDASWTLRALFGVGCHAEAHAFFRWILYATLLTQPDVEALYDVHGETDLGERTLDHLSGYEGSRPVRVGNGAHGQLQLDVYGELVAATYEYLRRGHALDRRQMSFVVGVARTAARRWREPDEGIWEVRHGRRHHTYSKVMCWAALDRVIRLHEEGKLEAPVEELSRERDAIREEVERRGFDHERGCYRGVFDEDVVDAALLRLPEAGYVAAHDERMLRTWRHVTHVLDAGEGMLYRYPPGSDGMEGREGAFAPCGFWAVEVEALAGMRGAAEERFERLLARANELGLYSEETDPATGRFLGNFPQAFTHIGLVNAALTLAEQPEGARALPRAGAAAPERGRVRVRAREAS